MDSPLIRLPFIIVSLAAVQKTMTPPHPPPGPDETAKSTKLEPVLRQRLGSLTARTILGIASLAEVATILACQFPRSPLSHNILKLLNYSSQPTLIPTIRPTPWFFLSMISIYLGSYIRWSCFDLLGKMFTFEMSIRKDHKLIKSGPYGIVRHPAYTGIILNHLGIFLWHGAPGSWVRESGVLNTTLGRTIAITFLLMANAITVGLLLRMSKEDEILKKKFGKEWDDWARTVPYKLIPGVI